MKKLWPFVSEFKFHFIGDFILAFLIMLLTILVPVLASIFIDARMGNDFVMGVVYILILMVALFVLNQIHNYFVLVFTKKFRMDYSEKLFLLMFGCDYQTLVKKSNIYYIDRITSTINTLSITLISTLPSLITSWFYIVITIIIALRYSYLMSGIFIVIILLSVIGYKKLNSKLSSKSQQLQQICAESFKNVLSVCDNTDTIKQSSNPLPYYKLIEESIRNIHFGNANLTAYANGISLSLKSLVDFLYYFLYFWICFLMTTQEITNGEFVMLSMLVLLFFNTLTSINQSNINLRDLEGVVAFIQEELIDLQEKDGNVELSDIHSIEFVDSKVGYGESVIVENMNVGFKEGDVVFISGETGSGKSTIMKALLKLIDASNVFVNNQALKTIKNSSLRENISYYSQNIMLFSGLFIDNITLGKTFENVLEKLKKMSFLDKFFEESPTLTQMLYHNGANLSGGDKQRILAARILIDESDVLILDEITSSMDEKTAQSVMQEIVTSKRGKLIFIISHSNQFEGLCTKKMLIEQHLVSCHSIAVH